MLLKPTVFVMESKWSFLEPWLTVLRDHLVKQGVDDEHPDPELNVKFTSPLPQRCTFMTSSTDFYLKLPMDELCRQNRGRLQLLREAVELFTLFAIVDNLEFKRVLIRNHFDNPFTTFPNYLKWNFLLVGDLSPRDPAATHSPVSWAMLLGFPDDPVEYSSDFREAKQKLNSMDLQETAMSVDSTVNPITWKIKDSTADLEGRCVVYETSTTTSPLSSYMKNVFDGEVPPVFQLRVCQITGILSKQFLFPETTLAGPLPLFVDIRHLTLESSTIPDLTWALAQTDTKKFKFEADSWFYDSGVVPQVVLNLGYFLNALLCGSLLCELGYDKCQRSVRRTRIDGIDLGCSEAPDDIFSALCSAVSELVSMGTNNFVTFSEAEELSQYRLKWLVYALCCGSSTVSIEEADISNVCLTQSTIAAVNAVVETKYPEPSTQRLSIQPTYGFVHITKGVRIRISKLIDGEEVNFILPRSCQYRALYNPVKVPGWVNFVVPGYGICSTKLEDGVVKFVPDATQNGYQNRKEAGRVQGLDIHFKRVEKSSLVTDLLSIIGKNLQNLVFRSPYSCREDLADVDLSLLAGACPMLERLIIKDGFNVSVSTYNDALRNWPVKMITISRTKTLPDLGPCLSDRMYRMARELVLMNIRHYAFPGDTFNLDEKMKLMIHDREHLPVTKKKFPLESKAALLSVLKHQKS